MEQNVLTVHQVAEYLQIGQRSVYKLVREGIIPGIKIMNKWRFDKREIDKILKFPEKSGYGARYRRQDIKERELELRSAPLNNSKLPGPDL